MAGVTCYIFETIEVFVRVFDLVGEGRLKFTEKERRKIHWER